MAKKNQILDCLTKAYLNDIAKSQCSDNRLN